MKFSRQALLGVTMMVGGSVMLYAMIQQVGSLDNRVQNQPPPEPVVLEPINEVSQPSVVITTDVATEQRILSEKYKEREARVAAQERRTQEFLAEQERAEKLALAKSRAENEQYQNNAVEPVIDEDYRENDLSNQEAEAINSEVEITKPVVKPRTDIIPEAPKQTQQPQISNKQKAQQEAEAKKKAEEEKRQREQKQAEEKAKREAEQAKKQAKEKARLEAEAKRQEAKKKAEEEAKAAKEKAAKEQAEKEKAERAKREAEQAKAPPSSPTSYTVKRGDGLIRLARQYNVPVEALAQANNLSTRANLHVGQKLTIPSKRQIARLEREAAQAEKKRQQEEEKARKSAEAKREAQQKLKEARKEVKETDAKGNFGVQVALASNQAKADEVAKKFQAAGYQVKTSRTSRGVRVMVGPERGKVAALALKDKINSDPKVNTTNAWVLYWR